MKKRPTSSITRRPNLNSLIHDKEFVKLKDNENRSLYHIQKAKDDTSNSKSQILPSAIKEGNISDNSTNYSSNNPKSIITYLAQESHDQLKNYTFNDTTKIMPSTLKPQKSSPTFNLKMSNIAAEICESKIEDEEAIKHNYEQFKKEFYRLVFDKNKNLLYTKPSEIKNFNLKDSSRASVESNSTDRFLNKIEVKYKNLHCEKILANNVESPKSARKPHHQKGRSHIDEIKKNSMNVLNMNLRAFTNEKVVEEAKLQIEKVSVESKEILDKISIENTTLKEDLRNTKQKMEDIAAENSALQRKNQILMKEIEELREKNECLTRNMSTIERFIPLHNMLKEKFPTEDIKGIINRFEKLENYCLTNIKRIDDLEEERRILKDEKNQVIKEIQNKKYELRDKEMENNKAILNIRYELDRKDIMLDQQKNIQDDYKVLMKKILDIYFKWSQKIKIFVEGEIKADLKDPLQILDVIDRMVEISTPQDLQEKFRKVIVSANMLMRRYFPENINDKFDADKIYDRINKYIADMENELKRLKNLHAIAKRSNSKKSP